MWFCVSVMCVIFLFKQKTAYVMRSSDCSSYVSSSDLAVRVGNLDDALVEDLLGNLVVGTPCRPLAAGQGLDATPHHHRRVTEGGDAMHLEIAENRAAVLGVAQLTEGIEHGLLHLGDVLPVGHADLRDVEREAAHEVRKIGRAQV